MGIRLRALADAPTVRLRVRDRRHSCPHRFIVVEAVLDPKRSFAAINCRTAKGLFDRLVGGSKKSLSRLAPTPLRLKGRCPSMAYPQINAIRVATIGKWEDCNRSRAPCR
jgi:hypothetical protein